MTEPQRRTIDKAQRLPENIPATLPPDKTPPTFKTAPVASSIKREGGKKRPHAPPRSIPIKPSPVLVQVPVQGASKVNSTLALAKRDSFNGQPGGAEGQVLKERAAVAAGKIDESLSQSVLK